VRIVVEHRDNALKVPNAALRFRPAGAAGSQPAAEAPQASGGPALQQFRQRLLEAVKPDAAQQQRLEEIFTDLRRKAAPLREISDETERKRRFERLRADMRSSIAALLRPEQRSGYEQLLREYGGRAASTTGRVWVPDGREAKPVELRLGLNDGTSTELVAGPLAEGDAVIVGLAAADKRDTGLPRMRLF
jgi:HlyD family secretion protein